MSVQSLNLSYPESGSLLLLLPLLLLLLLLLLPLVSASEWSIWGLASHTSSRATLTAQQDVPMFL